jgi:hypothetical protein
VEITTQAAFDRNRRLQEAAFDRGRRQRAALDHERSLRRADVRRERRWQLKSGTKINRVLDSIYPVSTFDSISFLSLSHLLRSSCRSFKFVYFSMLHSVSWPDFVAKTAGNISIRHPSASRGRHCFSGLARYSGKRPNILSTFWCSRLSSS